MSIYAKTKRKRQASLIYSDDDRFDGNLWLETGSPVKQQEVNDGRVLEVRDTREISPDAEMPFGGASAAQIRHGDNVAKAET